MSAPETVGDLLRGVSDDLARHFDDVEVPAPFAYARRQATVAPIDTPTDAPIDAPAVHWPHGRARAVVLAGPGVLAEPGGVRCVRTFAERANVPVANTWGAKGVLRWDSPHHMGTCGLQADDLALVGFGDYELIVATGIDPVESPEERFGLAPVSHISPMALGAMTDVARLFDEIPSNDLYGRLASVAQPGYVDESFPRHPARAVMDLKQSLGPETIVFGQPGPVGLWLARTFPTDRPGSICVPAVDRPGIAAALALAARATGLDAMAVTTDPVDEVSRAIVDAAPEGFRLERWGDDVDWSRTRELVDAAGPVVAWSDPEERP